MFLKCHDKISSVLHSVKDFGSHLFTSHAQRELDRAREDEVMQDQ